MSRVRFFVILALAVLCVGCGTSFLLPSYEDSRKTPGNESLEEARLAFEQIVEGSSTEVGIRALKFGAPFTDEELVGHLRMSAVLTESQSAGYGVFLDERIKNCIKREDASESCNLLVIRDGRHKSKGQGNPLLYYTGIRRTDEVSSWGYTIWLVLENGVVIHKQFEPSQSPTKVERRGRDFGRVVEYKVRP
ncbi:MAG: hypothetical protein WBL19_03165 [Minisyncoccia bacterium]